MTLTGPERMLLDGVDLKTYAKNVPSLGGNLRTAGRRGANVPTASRDGALYSPGKPFEQHSFPLSFWVRGCNDDGRVPSGSSARREFFARVQELTALFSKQNGLSILGHYAPDGTYREIPVECVAAQDWTVKGPNPIGRIDFTMVAPGAFWQSPLQSVSLIAGESSRLFTGATAPLNDALYTFVGPVMNPTITDEISGASVRYGATVNASQTLTINARDWSMSQTNGASTALRLLTMTRTQGRLMRLLPDNVARGYRVFFSGTSTSSATRLIVEGRAKFLNG